MLWDIAVRSMILRRVTEDIMPNAEISHEPGENVERDGGGGVPLSPKKYRPVAKAASHLLPQYAYLAREGGFLRFEGRWTINHSGIFPKCLKAAFTVRVDTR